MVKSAYIHIPFCRSKCHYCSFISFVNTEKKDLYIDTLIREIKEKYNNELLSTIYFGGGTPSVLNFQDFSKILRLLNYGKNTEITAELNPDDVDYDYLRGLYDSGINRLSFGCQTFDDNILKVINRRHTASQVIKAVGTAQKSGFNNISLDFIYGLPDQTPQMFYADLKKAVDLGVKHISLYGLTIEKGCYFYGKDIINLEDDIQADMYLGAFELLKSLGFEHYEVSNFCLPDFYSRHNMNYWNNAEYYGFGLAAHGYVNGIRYENQKTLGKYLDNPYKALNEKLVSEKEKLEEEIFLGFRRMSGVNVGSINQKFGIDFEEKYLDILKKYEGLNLLKRTKTGYALTLNGVLVSNVILADFIS